MKRFIRAFGGLLALASLAFLVGKFIDRTADLPAIVWGCETIVALALSVSINVVIVALGAVIWMLLLQGGGIQLPLKQAYIVIGQSQIGKYLPGNVFQYFGRVVIGKTYGVPAEATILSMGAETLVVILSSAALVTLGSWLSGLHPAWITQNLWTSRTTSLFFLLITMGVFFAGVVGLSRRIQQWIYMRLSYLHIGRLIGSSLLCLLVFALFGFMISLLLKMVWGMNAALPWCRATWGFALAWLLGFVVPGAPGGIGVREVALVSLYSREIGEAAALSLALLLRVVTVVGDFLAFALAWWLGKRYPA